MVLAELAIPVIPRRHARTILQSLAWPRLKCRYGSSLSTWSEDGVWVAYAAHNSVVVARPWERALHHILTGHTNRRGMLHWASVPACNPLFQWQIANQISQDHVLG